MRYVVEGESMTGFDTWCSDVLECPAHADKLQRQMMMSNPTWIFRVVEHVD